MKLLILDIDETLLYATKKKFRNESDLVIGPYNIYFRLHLSLFLKKMAEHYEMAIWTSSGGMYAEEIVDNLPLVSKPCFVWSRKRCTKRWEPETREYVFIKDLKKVKRKGYDLDKILIIDDSPEKIYRNYGNHIRVKPFTGDTNDDELLALEKYLIKIASVNNFRTIEKRRWRSEITT